MTDGSVYFYHTNPLADNAMLAGAASAVHAIFDQYAALGIKASRIGPSNPIHIVIGNYGNPTYSALTGNLYLDWANIQNLQSSEAAFQANLSHEIAHWLQDCTYVMTSASFSQLARWLPEVSAENLSFVQNPAALGSKLASYGRLQEEGDVRYGMQLAPFAWPGRTDARYVQAIPVHVGMCDDPASGAMKMEDLILKFLAGYGHFEPSGPPTDSIPYKWVQDEAFPEGEGDFTLTASAQVTATDVQVEYTFVVPEPAEGTSWLPWGGARHARGTVQPLGPLATISLAAVGLVALGRHPRRAKLLLGVAILGLLPQLAACDLDFDFWGTVNGKYTFHKLTYVPENFEPIPDQIELWQLTEGEGTMDLDLTLKMSMEEEAEQSACQVTNSVKTDLLVLAKGAITPAELGD